MATSTFYVTEVDESAFWSSDALQAFGGVCIARYFFREGEGVHLCSLEAFTRMDPLMPEFPNVPDDLIDEANQAYYEGGADTIYVKFIDVATTKRKLSRPIVIEHDEDEDPWEMAREYLQGNYVCV